MTINLLTLFALVPVPWASKAMGRSHGHSVVAHKRKRPGHLIVTWAFGLFRECGQGQGRTADLPLFSCGSRPAIYPGSGSGGRLMAPGVCL
ncbi:hypothetical protein [Microtetraspora niveoalba]|uniref:hypothetical protein n=1 Tax=Microtetraspora niveoalba TaxID=46175 RepID=UPI0012FC37D1|nr:hypothetical protein [Microtetraspora niveoalba]